MGASSRLGAYSNKYGMLQAIIAVLPNMNTEEWKEWIVMFMFVAIGMVSISDEHKEDEQKRISQYQVAVFFLGLVRDMK